MGSQRLSGGPNSRASFTTQDWFSFWTLVIAVLTVIVNVGIALWNSAKVDRKLLSMDETIEETLGKLDDKVNGIDWGYAYILGVLDGAGITKGRKRR